MTYLALRDDLPSRANNQRGLSITRGKQIICAADTRTVTENNSLHECSVAKGNASTLLIKMPMTKQNCGNLRKVCENNGRSSPKPQVMIQKKVNTCVNVPRVPLKVGGANSPR